MRQVNNATHRADAMTEGEKRGRKERQSEGEGRHLQRERERARALQRCAASAEPALAKSIKAGGNQSADSNAKGRADCVHTKPTEQT